MELTMRVFRPGLAVLACVALMALTLSASAQMPGPGDAIACACLRATIDASNADMTAQNQALAAAQADLARLDQQLAAARGNVDVNNPQAVGQFKQLLAQRDAAFQHSTGGLVAAAQAATARYNAAVGDYNNACAGRPIPPPPPGPLACPGPR
jgi:hypothetical protein